MSTSMSMSMPAIPPKLYYSISEVSEMTGVKAHVLRYWESEFSDLRPKKNRAGNRSYREKDIRMVLTIRDLLYRQGYTIQGARNQLRDRGRADAAPAAVVVHAPEPAATLDFPAPPPEVDDPSREILRALKRELLELRKRLD